jgi:hypothetical protein
MYKYIGKAFIRPGYMRKDEKREEEKLIKYVI